MKTKPRESCFIGLGSNLENPVNQVRSAIEEIADIPSVSLLAQSALYETKAIGPKQPDYINAVVHIKTTLTPQDLFAALKAIEIAHHRLREVKWGPRTLDCDILLYGSQRVQTSELHIPHPEMLNRGFVMIPLMEIAPDLSLPDGTKIQNAVNFFHAQDVRKLNPEVIV